MEMVVDQRRISVSMIKKVSNEQLFPQVSPIIVLAATLFITGDKSTFTNKYGSSSVHWIVSQLFVLLSTQQRVITFDRL